MNPSGDNELVSAAATGAAAAVAAVEDEQREDERAATIESASFDASIAAETAAENAQQAASVAEEAAAAASTAVSEASSAAAKASEATEEAYSARADIQMLREEVNAGWQGLRSYLDERFAPPPQSGQPTEVVVTHEPAGTPGATDNTGSSRTDTGSGGIPEEPGIRRRRHRFGHGGS